MTGRFTTTMRSLRDGGIRSTACRGAKWLSSRLDAFGRRPLDSVYADDLIAVDWSTSHAFNAQIVPRPPSGYRVAWLITPPGRTSESFLPPRSASFPPQRFRSVSGPFARM